MRPFPQRKNTTQKHNNIWHYYSDQIELNHLPDGVQQGRFVGYDFKYHTINHSRNTSLSLGGGVWEQSCHSAFVYHKHLLLPLDPFQIKPVYKLNYKILKCLCTSVVLIHRKVVFTQMPGLGRTTAPWGFRLLPPWHFITFNLPSKGHSKLDYETKTVLKLIFSMGYKEKTFVMCWIPMKMKMRLRSWRSAETGHLYLLPERQTLTLINTYGYFPSGSLGHHSSTVFFFFFLKHCCEIPSPLNLQKAPTCPSRPGWMSDLPGSHSRTENDRLERKNVRHWNGFLYCLNSGKHEELPKSYKEDTANDRSEPRPSS